MGMAASQVRLLQLTGRKNDIGRQLQSLSSEKMSLTREMKGVTKDYQNALSSKVFKWTTNSGASYVDLSYSTLMKPSSANGNIPYLLTNTNGAVMIDSTYKKYAEMISSNGASGGDYESVRTQILTSLCNGLTEEDLEKASEMNSTLNEAAEKVNNLKASEPDEPVKYSNASTFLANAGNVSGIEISKGGTLDLGNASTAKANLNSFISGLKTNMSNVLSDEDKTAFNTVCDSFYSEYSVYIGSSSEKANSLLNNDVSPLRISGANYTLDVSKAVETILGQYEVEGGTVEQNSYGTMTYAWRDKTSSEWQSWSTEYPAWEAEYNEAMDEYNQAVDNNNQVFTSENESKIAFYDKLFNAIVDNGWEYNNNISDDDYLNQMLQNNQFLITTMDRSIDDDGNTFYEYDSAIASNFGNLVSVNDSDAANEALAEYEYQKSIINEKESRIDTRMQDLETEQSAINEMIKGIETVRNDNVERTFSIFS